MVKKKILIISDYVKKHYIGTKQGQSYNKFMETNEGRFLKSLMLESFEKVGYEESCSYKAIFAIPEIPNLIKENKKNPELSLYTTPSLQKVKEYKENLLERIYEYNPDVVIVTGSISIKSIFGSGSIKAMRTLPGEIEIKDKKFPYFVTYSPGFVRSNPNYISLSKIDMQHLGKFLKDGSDGLKKSKVDYTILKNDSADKVVRLLGYIKDNFGKTPRDAVAWDYETNSLSGTSDTSKVITASISTSDHKGITFPIDHPEYPWNKDDRKKVINAWLDFLISPIWKVGHNVSFDMRQTKTIIKPIQFKNTLDTLVAYYIGVSQENKGGKSLKDLALLFTDMGNYDKQLDEFKSWFNSGFDKGKSKELKDKYEGTTYVQRVKAYLQEGTEIEDKYYLEYLTDSQKIVAFKTAKRLLEEQGFPDTVYNEQEPSTDFSYAWIPYEVLAYYACGDVDATKRINYYMWDTYISKVESFTNLYTKHYPELINSLTNIEANGFALDVDYLKEVKETFIEKIAHLEEAMMKTDEVKKTIAYKEKLFALGLQEKTKPVKERDAVIYKYYTDLRNGLATQFSPTKKFDLGYALFGVNGYKLPPEKKYIPKSVMTALRNKQITEDDLTYMDYSTGKDSLDMLAKLHPDFELVKLVKEYVRLNKLLTTYTDSLIEKADSDDVVHGRFVSTGCITGDSLVLTNEGIKRIDSLSDFRKKGEFEEYKGIDVINHYGNVVKSNYYYSGYSEGVDIELYNGVHINATNNHPLIKNIPYSVENHPRKSTKKFSNNEWEIASNIKQGDYLMMPVGSNLYGKNTVIDSVKNIESIKSINTNSLIPKLPHELTEELAEFVGMYMADGSYNENNGSFNMSISNNSIEVINRVVDSVKKLFSLDAKVFLSNDLSSRAHSVRVSSVVLGNYLKRYFYFTKYADIKDIPNLILESPKNVQEAFLRGLSLDCGLNRKKYPSIYFSTTSKSMSSKLNVILNNMGILASIRVGKSHRENEKDLYYNVIGTKYSQVYYDKVGFLEEQKNELIKVKLDSYTPNRKPKLQGFIIEDNIKDRVLVKVKSIKKVDCEEYFDLHVPDGSSFVANGIYNHNTGTTRLSSNNPNMQNISKPSNNPSDIDYEYPIKRAFIPHYKKGQDTIINLDFSSQEAHLAAVIAHDDDMIGSFLDGDDVHKATAALMYNKDVDEVTKDERFAAKSTTFG